MLTVDHVPNVGLPAATLQAALQWFPVLSSAVPSSIMHSCSHPVFLAALCHWWLLEEGSP
jgi:hypothetical protein